MKRFPHHLVLLLTAVLAFGGGCGDTGDMPDAAATPMAASAGTLRFTSVAEEAGLGDFLHLTGAYGDVLFPESMGSGCGFIDYNGDGWLDILMVGGGTWPGHGEQQQYALWLYRNNQDGTFPFASEEAGLAGIDTYGIGLAAADYDNDGDQDIYFTTLYQNMLFRNDDGVFTEVGRQAGVQGDPVWSSSALFSGSTACPCCSSRTISRSWARLRTMWR